MVEQEIVNLFVRLNIPYEKDEQSDRDFKRYRFKINEENGDVLLSTKTKIYMSAGFINERVICDENYKFIGALKSFERLLKEHINNVSNNRKR